jgi:asparagine synthase (glutamine-hydrolysing)
MCGIAGIIRLDGPGPVDQQRVAAMANAIVHRGPDEDGVFTRPGLVMANRRLSIVGLADGRQPIHNEDRSVSVVFNGELFDYPEVRAQLISRGHQYRTHCDTEILPHLWEDYGEAMIERLRGQFAFALWDEKRQRLTVARDRFGICPLYWSRQKTADGEFLLFASEIKALLASGMIEAKPDPRGINHVFTFFALPGPLTCFEGIHCLLPGHYLTIDFSAGTVRDRVYWEIDFPDRGDEEWGDFRRFGDNSANPLVDEFEEVMQRAVARRLRADVPVVSYLSGGVDSSLVVAMASRQRTLEGKSPIPTFTIAVSDKSLNERDEAAEVASSVGSQQTIVDFGRAEVLNAYPELTRAAEGPVIDTACAALLALAKVVHQHGYKVALTGEGADEWLAGYPWYKIHRVLSVFDAVPGVKLSPAVRRAYLRATGSPLVPQAQISRAQQAVGGPNAWLDAYGLFGLSKQRFYSGGMWERIGDHVPFADLGLNLDRAKKWHPLNRSLYVGARVMLPGLLLSCKGDRVAMNSSVEARYPFLDEEVFAFLARLHPSWKFHRMREKLILRYLADRWVPRTIAWRRKAMFRAPLDGFHTMSFPTFVDQLLSPESLRKAGYFDPASVKHWRDRFLTMRTGSNQRTMVEMGLVGVVATQLWHQTFIDGSLADLPTLARTVPRAACPPLSPSPR